jgi:hypothetical protein
LARHSARVFAPAAAVAPTSPRFHPAPRRRWPWAPGAVGCAWFGRSRGLLVALVLERARRREEGAAWRFTRRAKVCSSAEGYQVEGGRGCTGRRPAEAGEPVPPASSLGFTKSGREAT